MLRALLSWKDTVNDTVGRTGNTDSHEGPTWGFQLFVRQNTLSSLFILIYFIIIFPPSECDQIVQESSFVFPIIFGLTRSNSGWASVFTTFAFSCFPHCKYPFYMLPRGHTANLHLRFARLFALETSSCVGKHEKVIFFWKRVTEAWFEPVTFSAKAQNWHTTDFGNFGGILQKSSFSVIRQVSFKFHVIFAWWFVLRPWWRSISLQNGQHSPIIGQLNY